MAKVFEEITDHMRGWISRQTMFFVATARLDAEGHVNASPKGPWDDARFGELLERGGFTDASIPEARRSIVLLHVTGVSDSCGYGVPLMELQGLREHHALTSAKAMRVEGPTVLGDCHRAKNAVSLDGLPAVG